MNKGHALFKHHEKSRHPVIIQTGFAFTETSGAPVRHTDDVEVIVHVIGFAG
jgi:hypothetical protein